MSHTLVVSCRTSCVCRAYNCVCRAYNGTEMFLTPIVLTDLSADLSNASHKETRKYFPPHCLKKAILRRCGWVSCIFLILELGELTFIHGRVAYSTKSEGPWKREGADQRLQFRTQTTTNGHFIIPTDLSQSQHSLSFYHLCVLQFPLVFRLYFLGCRLIIQCPQYAVILVVLASLVHASQARREIKVLAEPKYGVLASNLKVPGQRMWKM